MEKLPQEIFDIILSYLTLTDWKCLRLTSRAIYSHLSDLSSYSRIHPVFLVPRSLSGLTLIENSMSLTHIDHLSLANFDLTTLGNLIRTSESFRFFLGQLSGLSFANSTTLIDSRLFYELLSHCKSLEKLDLSDYKFFFLSHNFALNSEIFPSIKRLNLSGNTHLSDYAFNRLLAAFPNLIALYLLRIPVRNYTSAGENRSFLTFENVYGYFQKHQNRFQTLAISFDSSLSCDAQIKRLFSEVPAKLTYFHIDGCLSISALLHLLLLFNNQLETLIVGRLTIDHTGCQPLFDALCQYASNLKQLCLFLGPTKYSHLAYPQISRFPNLPIASNISLKTLTRLNDLDIQTLYPLNEIDLIHLFASTENLKYLKKLALSRNTTDEVIKSICTDSLFIHSLTHLNLNNCSSLSNRSVLLINKYLLSLEELSINYNVNINDFAFIGLSICGIGKSIEWLDHTLINRKFIEDLPIWTLTETHQSSCRCVLPNYFSSSCIKLRLKDFSFDSDENSDRTLSLLTEHQLFHQYFHSINQLKSLKTLKLRECVQITDRLFRFGFRFLPNLKLLDLNSCEKLTDKYLSTIGRTCPSIESIDLTGCHRITDAGRQLLRQQAKRLKVLDF